MFWGLIFPGAIFYWCFLYLRFLHVQVFSVIDLIDFYFLVCRGGAGACGGRGADLPLYAPTTWGDECESQSYVSEGHRVRKSLFDDFDNENANEVLILFFCTITLLFFHYTNNSCMLWLCYFDLIEKGNSRAMIRFFLIRKNEVKVWTDQSKALIITLFPSTV